MGELGLTGAPLPESIGGGGFSYLGWALVMEEIGAADMASAVTLSVHLLSQFPVLNYGTDEQVGRWLPPMLAGEALGAFCLTEPSGGSDAAALADAGRRGLDDGALPADRHQDLDLERARGGSLPRLRDGRPVEGLEGHHRVPGREGHARVPVRRPREEDGHPGLPRGGADLRRRGRPRREPPRRRGRGIPNRALEPGRGPDLDRRRLRRASPARRSSSPPRTSSSARPSARRCRSCRA